METTTCPLKDDWVKKMLYMPKMEQYSSLEKKEILTYATTWMNLEDIMLREINNHRRINTT